VGRKVRTSRRSKTFQQDSRHTNHRRTARSQPDTSDMRMHRYSRSHFRCTVCSPARLQVLPALGVQNRQTVKTYSVPPSMPPFRAGNTWGAGPTLCVLGGSRRAVRTRLRSRFGPQECYLGPRCVLRRDLQQGIFQWAPRREGVPGARRIARRGTRLAKYSVCYPC
jgi:hypothetical protein